MIYARGRVPGRAQVFTAAHSSLFELDGALRKLDGDVRDRPADPSVRDARAELCFRLGWYRDAREELRAALTIDSTAVDRHLRFASVCLEGHDVRLAAHHLGIVVRRNRRAVDHRFLLAKLLGELGRRRAAVRHVVAGLRADPSPDRCLAAAEILIDAGDFAAARRCLARARAHDATAVAARVRIAQISLWRGDVARATRAARDLIAIDRGCAGAYGLLGATSVLRGELEQALTNLDEAVRLSPNDHDSLVWRSEARRRLGRYQEAQEDAQRAISTTTGFSLIANIARVLAVSRHAIAHDWKSLRDPSSVDLLEAIAPLVRASRPRDLGAACAALERALDAFRGNRSRTPTICSRGRLKRFHASPDPRLAARMTQQLIRTRDLEEVLDQFRSLVERHPRSATVLCHRGEVFLWAGRYDDAREDFQRALAIDRSTRWAWIGDVAVALLRGELDEALAIDEEERRHTAPPPGRTMFTYRGEVHRRRGDRAAARRDLEEAVRLDPGRISAWINLALLADEEGDPSLASTVLRRLEDRASGLVIDAARELGLPLRPWPPSRTEVRSLLDRALSMMRGNRSSVLISYFAGDRIRFARPFSPG